MKTFCEHDDCSFNQAWIYRLSVISAISPVLFFFGLMMWLEVPAVFFISIAFYLIMMAVIAWFWNEQLFRIVTFMDTILISRLKKGKLSWLVLILFHLESIFIVMVIACRMLDLATPVLSFVVLFACLTCGVPIVRYSLHKFHELTFIYVIPRKAQK